MQKGKKKNENYKKSVNNLRKMKGNLFKYKRNVVNEKLVEYRKFVILDKYFVWHDIEIVKLLHCS